MFVSDRDALCLGGYRPRCAGTDRRKCAILSVMLLAILPLIILLHEIDPPSHRIRNHRHPASHRLGTGTGSRPATLWPAPSNNVEQRRNRFWRWGLFVLGKFSLLYSSYCHAGVFEAVAQTYAAIVER